METNNSSIFSLVWALMPLSTDELEQIPLNHRIRPYLIFEINDDLPTPQFPIMPIVKGLSYL